ncbi:TetR/AcrR family transcriptional regulator [Candidatus Mycobacterium wuenschmannii]|uniref:TetR/AcrR family transcriptional regulator n=1 Tax=Candidatus Mycobacterium wuenschmannii TaxID=3027808 RepID=A0ABY8VWR2_9MYCO|nr:TetR/AcrR family transcriptional regulator [Candidatus Mycobacterium wuenschmannii]WIM88083.1 TetR/AcrR family transcriptional regulator [Candidatus Mycobacterium wuenschmannii]
MARRHGWGGDPPADDGEATERIVAAAVEQMSRNGGADISLADVAKSLGVIRQTVYRYFSTAEALMKAAALASVEHYMARLQRHLLGIHDPAEALTEAVAFTLENLHRTPQIGHFLEHPYVEASSVAVTSQRAAVFGREMVERFDVDWAAAGFDDALLEETVEFALRTMQSFFLSPSRPRRSREQLRTYLRRWVGGALDAHAAALHP